MTMKENHNRNSFDSLSFSEETDPLTFGSKDRYQLNDSRMDANHTELVEKYSDDRSNLKVTDDSSMDNEKGTMGSPKKAGQNGRPHLLSVDNENGIVGSPRKESEDGLSHQLSIWDKDTDSLSSDSSDIDKEHASPEHESFDTVEGFVDCNHSDSRDSSPPLITDKDVLERDTPELEVFYKEIDCQIWKGICIDEGRHQKDVNVVERCRNEKPGCLFSQPPNDINHYEAKEDSSLDSVSSFTADLCRSNEETDDKPLVSQERLDACLEKSLQMDTVEHCESENPVETSEAFFDATAKVETECEDVGTLSSLGTDGGNKVMQAPDLFLNQEAVVPESRVPSAEAGGTENDDQANCLLNNSKVEKGSITFNFSSPEGVVVGNGMNENIEEQSTDTGDVHKDVNAVNHPDASEAKVQCPSNRLGDSSEPLISSKDVEEQSADTGDVPKDVNAENHPDAREAKVQCPSNTLGDSGVESLISNKDVEEQSTDSGQVHNDIKYENFPDIRDGKVQCTSNRVDDSHRQSTTNKGNSNDGSATSYDQCVTSEGSNCDNAHKGSLGDKQSNSDDIPTDDPAESPNNKSPVPKTDAQGADRIAPNYGGKDTGDVPGFGHLQHDMGETSFSAASLITYSGPIAFSGSLSHRSDGSTTSGKSFAFPILQSEWNSSPVRMAKADRRHFRKHKGWRSGLLCCRF